MTDLVERLRGLSQAKHDDFSIGEEAAAEIQRLTVALAASDARNKTVRKEALEEAAKIADNWIFNFGEVEIIHTSAKNYATDTAKDIADIIRALIEKEPKP